MKRMHVARVMQNARCLVAATAVVAAAVATAATLVRRQMLLQKLGYFAHQSAGYPCFRRRPQNGIGIRILSQGGGRLSLGQMLLVDNEDLRQNVLDGLVIAHKSDQRKHSTSLRG